ncbi:NAD(P) transhydrogenase subunit alpha [Muricoccus radiodurans]|uniref:NAD(P) transhydrogenase subunit alpha n=1 Tax=Muricoccus radiodurans TaxID=2231721 RepID=UPI003CEC55F1
MNPTELANRAAETANRALALAAEARAAAAEAAPGMGDAIAAGAAAANPFLLLLTIFLLACFVGYHVVWSVTPALHSPLMGVTNAISSVIVVGAMLAVGLGDSWLAQAFGFLAVVLAAVNIAGGFMVTRRMLAMFQRKG